MCEIGWASKIVLVGLVDSMVTTSLMVAIVAILGIDMIAIGAVEGMILVDLTSRYRRCLRHRPFRLRIRYRKRME